MKIAKSAYLLAIFVNAIDLWAVGPGATAKAAKGMGLAFLGGLALGRTELTKPPIPDLE